MDIVDREQLLVVNYCVLRLIAAHLHFRHLAFVCTVWPRLHRPGLSELYFSEHDPSHNIYVWRLPHPDQRHQHVCHGRVAQFLLRDVLLVLTTGCQLIFGWRLSPQLLQAYASRPRDPLAFTDQHIIRFDWEQFRCVCKQHNIQSPILCTVAYWTRNRQYVSCFDLIWQRGEQCTMVSKLDLQLLTRPDYHVVSR